MPDTNPTPTPLSPQERIEQKLDHLITLLDHINRRDRWRTIGGFIRGMVTIVPTIILLASTIYLIFYGSDIMQMIIKQTTAAASQQVQNSFVQDLMKNIKPGSSNFQVQGN